VVDTNAGGCACSVTSEATNGALVLLASLASIPLLLRSGRRRSRRQHG
jgi:hypothetical protein